MTHQSSQTLGLESSGNQKSKKLLSEATLTNFYRIADVIFVSRLDQMRFNYSVLAASSTMTTCY